MADPILYYNFSNTDKTLTGSIYFNQSAAADQQVTTSEGLNIFANYNGQPYTQGNDSSAVLYTDELGSIGDLGLGLQFVIPNLFSVYSEDFIPANLASSVQTVTYTSVPTFNEAPTDLVFDTSTYYNFSNVDKTLTGSLSFIQSTAADQQITIAEGLKISFTYGGKTYSQTDDSLALLSTNFSGDIGDLELELQFVSDDFTIYAENFNVGNITQKITYTRVPAPANVVLSASKIDENIAGGTFIGTFSSTDQDANNTFTYSLVSGTGDADNTVFTIDGNNLKINSSPDFETKSSYNIRVQTTDNGGLTFQKTLAIAVNDLNEAPTDLVFDTTTYYNFSNVDKTLIGSLSFIQSTAADQQITIAEGLKISFTYGGKNYTQTDDSLASLLTNFSGDIGNLGLGLQFVSNEFTINAENFNVGNITQKITYTRVPAPANVVLSASKIDENIAAETFIGTFSSTDEDANNTFTYSLVPGTGDADNTAFTIDGNNLKINSSPDFETKSSYNIRVQTTDNGELTSQKILAIAVNDLNESPTDLVFDTTTYYNFSNVDKTLTGSLSFIQSTAADQQITIAEGLKISFTYGGKTYSQTDDSLALLSTNFSGDIGDLELELQFVSDDFTIYAENFNVGNITQKITYTRVPAPANVVLSASKIDENIAGGTFIGTFSSTDQDANNTFTYSLVSGTGDADNTVFTIDGNNLKINSSPDFETKSSYNIRVQTTDNGGLTFQKTLAIAVNDLNEAPTDLVFDTTTYYNFSNVDKTLIGSLSFIQSTAADQQITIAEGLKISFTYGGKTYTQTDDSLASLLTNFSGDIGNLGLGLQFVSNEFTINAENFNVGNITQKITYTRVPAPANVVLSASKIDENIAAGTFLGTFSSTDEDANNTFTYSLVTGTGDADNTAFTIDGNNLKINSSPDFETKSSYNIRVQTTDNGELTSQKILAIAVNDLNEAPTDLSLGVTSVNENVAINTVIGTFNSTDQDANNTFTYSLVSGTGDADNATFTINGNKLQINSSPNFDIKSSYKIRVKTTDKSGLFFEKSLNVGVNNIVFPAQLTKGSDDVFNIKGDNGKGILKITIASSTPNSNQLNELGVFNVDDAAGTVKDDAGKSLLPGADGYSKAALARAKVLLSTIANLPNGFSNSDVVRSLQLDFGYNLRFYLVQGTTTQTVINKGSYSDVVFSSTQNIKDLGNNAFSINFPNLVVNIQPTNQSLDSGLSNQFGQQGSTTGEVLYVNDKVNASFTVNREAAYDNFIGFYQVTDETGTINVNGTIYKPGDSGYTQAAINNRVVGLTGSNQVTITSNGKFSSNTIFAPFIIANADPSTYISRGNSVYFSFLGANPTSDKQVDHIRLLGNNTFGFEDLASGGDQDFNDIIVRINFS